MLELQSQPEQSRGDRIRARFSISGGDSISSFTHRLIEENFWSEDDDQKVIFRAHREEVRRELRKPTANGLPYAGQTESRDEHKAPIWRPRTLWEAADYVLNINEYRSQEEALAVMRSGLYEEAVDRYGELRMRSLMTGQETAA